MYYPNNPKHPNDLNNPKYPLFVDFKCLAVGVFGLFAVVPLLNRAQIAGYSAINFARCSFCFNWAHFVRIKN